MAKPYQIPSGIIARWDELNQLVERNPLYIPLDEAAEYLHMNAEGLRASIMNGQCPFGIAWQKDIRGNKAFKIQTLKFWLWCANLSGIQINEAGRKEATA